MLDRWLAKEGREQEGEDKDRPEENGQSQLMITIPPQPCSSSKWGGV